MEITGSAHGILLSVLCGVSVETSRGDCVTLCSYLCYHESNRRGVSYQTTLGSSDLAPFSWKDSKGSKSKEKPS